MRIMLGPLATLICVLAGTSPAHALPDLKKPAYGYAFRAPDNAAFSARHRGGTPTAAAESALDYYLFEPRYNGAGAPSTAPVLVYLHGATTNPDPKTVKAQITHYVRSGFTVVYPVYCNRSGWCLDFDKQEDQAFNATLWALSELLSAGHVAPATGANGRLEYAFVSHSLGSVIAARVTAKLGALVLPTPHALIMHDPAGYQLQFGTVDIPAIMPLTQASLATVPADTRLIMLVAEGSVGLTNSSDTIRALQTYLPVTQKEAWIVPSECVSSTFGSTSYTCPTGIDATNDEQHSFWSHVYVSVHDTAANDQYLTTISRVGFFDQTLACAREVMTGTTQSRCSGSLRTDMGVWIENNVTTRTAAPKYAYPMFLVAPGSGSAQAQ